MAETPGSTLYPLTETGVSVVGGGLSHVMDASTVEIYTLDVDCGNLHGSSAKVESYDKKILRLPNAVAFGPISTSRAVPTRFWFSCSLRSASRTRPVK